MYVELRGSLNISCTSAGNPFPMVSWTFNGSATLFDQTDTPLEPYLTEESVWFPGRVVSTLHIRNARYEDVGVYTCTGSNAPGGISKSATVNVELLGNIMCLCVMRREQVTFHLLTLRFHLD